MSIIQVDFKNRKVIGTAVHNYQPPKPFDKQEQGGNAPIERLFYKKANELGWKFQHFEPVSYDQIMARFGDTQPRGGIMYKNAGKIVDGVYYVDAYGRGCTSNAIGNPYKKRIAEQGYWNRPFPFPVDVLMVYEFLLKHKDEIKSIYLGCANDPCAWMDERYKVTRELICMFNHFNKPYTIFTASDLIAKDGVVQLLNPELATVKMRIPDKVDFKEVVDNGVNGEYERSTGSSPRGHIELYQKYETPYTEEIAKRVEPGAPSLLRRNKAVNELLELGLKVIVDKNLFWKAV